ncbi:MAG: tetratricopeptide (TPR) repeat protein [Myxococcota bacterium]|jgi:tetratricopeptide (TPR) repeat protein
MSIFRLALLATVTALVACGGEQTNPASPPVAKPNSPLAGVTDKIPPAFSAPTDVVTGAVQLAADTLDKDPAKISAAVVAATTVGRMMPRDLLSDAPDAPRTASELAPALGGKDVGVAASFEQASLLAALLKAKGHTEIGYGIVAKARWSATELAARHYVVRVGDGPWLATDSRPVSAGLVTALSDTALLAHRLAWRGLGWMPTSPKKAARAIKFARELQPADPAIRFLMGEAQINEGLAELGVQTMEQAAKTVADALTWYRLGRLAKQEGRLFRAKEYFDKSIAGDAAFVEPHRALAELAIDRLDVSPRAEHVKILEEAAVHVATARKVDDKAPGVRIDEAQIAVLRGDLDTSLALLTEETELHPSREDGWLILAQVLTIASRETEAMTVLDNALKAGVETANVLKGQATLAASTGDFAKALPALERALELAPDDPELRPQLAQLYRYHKQIDKARGLLEAQLGRFDDDLTSTLLLAQLELDEERPDRALTLVDAVLSAVPDQKEAILIRYLTLLQLKRPAAVIEVAEAKALEAAGGHRQLGEVLLEQGRLDAGEKALVAGLEAEPNDAIIRVYLVGLYHRLGRLDEAKVIRDTTVALMETDADRVELNALFDAAIAQATAPAPDTVPSPETPIP